MRRHWRFPTNKRELTWTSGDGASLHHSGLQSSSCCRLNPFLNKTHSCLALLLQILWTRRCNFKDNRNKLKVLIFTPAGDWQSSAEDHGTPPTGTFNQSDSLFNTAVWFIRRHFATLPKTIVIYDKAEVTHAGNAGRAQTKAIGHFHNTGGERLKPEGQKVRVHLFQSLGYCPAFVPARK